MLINYRNEMLHDSSQDLFRDPVGAVSTGTSVTIRFRARLENVSSVYLCLYRKDFREEHVMRAHRRLLGSQHQGARGSGCLLVLFYGQYWR